MKQCLNCNNIIKGRPDKKFCSKECSSQYHQAKRKQEMPEEVVITNRILLKNRRILLSLLEKEKKPKLKVSKLLLSQLGFNFQYITGIYSNRQGKLYHYVYDFAWMEFSNQEILIV